MCGSAGLLTSQNGGCRPGQNEALLTGLEERLAARHGAADAALEQRHRAAQQATERELKKAKDTLKGTEGELARLAEELEAQRRANAELLSREAVARKDANAVHSRAAALQAAEGELARLAAEAVEAAPWERLARQREAELAALEAKLKKAKDKLKKAKKSSPKMGTPKKGSPPGPPPGPPPPGVGPPKLQTAASTPTKGSPRREQAELQARHDAEVLQLEEDLKNFAEEAAEAV